MRKSACRVSGEKPTLLSGLGPSWNRGLESKALATVPVFDGQPFRRSKNLARWFRIGGKGGNCLTTIVQKARSSSFMARQR